LIFVLAALRGLSQPTPVAPAPVSASAPDVAAAPTAPAAPASIPTVAQKTAPAAPASAAVVPAPAAPAAPAADTPAAPAAPEVVIKDDAPAAPMTVKGKDHSGNGTLSVDFPDEEIRNILRNVADLFELNLVIPDTLQGKTSIKLRDVTWRQIFQVVLSPVGYTFVEDGNIIKIVSNESLQQEPVSTEVFIINYARAADIKPTVDSLVDPAAGGKIVVDARSNSLVITERPSRMNRIRPIIAKLDRATDQVMIESKFVEVSDRDVKNIGVNWASLAGYSVGAGGGGENGAFGGYNRTQGQDASNGSNGSSTTTNGTNNSTSNTQSSGSNASNSVTSANGAVTSTATTAITSAIGTAATSGTTGAFSETAGLLQSLTNTGNTARTLSAVFSADQFKLVLSALQTLSTTKVVSNPTIVTLNNTEATINVGEEDPIPKYSYNEQRGSFEVSGFDYKPIGVLLKVTPQVNSRGFIKLTLAPEVSQKNGTVSFGGAGGAEIPIIATRKATTQVSLKDGYTMGIGGLLTQNAIKGQSKVPVLGSIPVLGRLFRSDNKDTTTTNLIIFITAKSISAEGAPIEQVFDSAQVRQLDMHRSDLPGYRDGSDPFIPEPAPAPAPTAAADNGKTTAKL
jgi:type IV pilus assembly protein PilQ